MQASFSHLMIPTIVLLTTVPHYHFLQTYSREAILSALIITLASMLHMYLPYLGDYADYQHVFWNIVYLMSQVPLSISSIFQQQTYAIRRLSVFFMIYNVSVYQTLFLLLFLPINFIKGLSSSEGMFANVIHYFGCLFSVQPSSTYCEVSWIALCAVVLISIAAQLSQITLVRRCNYNETAIAVSMIPILVFVLFRFNVTHDILGLWLSTLLRSRAHQEHSSMFFESSIFFIVAIAGIVFRLSPKNKLVQEYILPPDPFFVENRSLFHLYAPFFQINGDEAHHRISITPRSHRTNSHEITPSQVDRQETGTCLSPISSHQSTPTRVTSNHSHEITFSSTGKPPTPPGSLTSTPALSPTVPRYRSHSLQALLRSHRSLHPFFLPNPMRATHLPTRVSPQPADAQSLSEAVGESVSVEDETATGLVRPVMMNQWTGTVLCEYTDYKRHYDYSSHRVAAAMAYKGRDEDEPEADDDPISDVDLDGPLHETRENKRACSVWQQYTASHITQLGDVEALMQRLYAYHRMGSLAAAMVAQQASEGEAGEEGETYEMGDA
eukprot:GHVN01029963.1.p1 GENE.GHVN01029963.1~~GHVN01029963.1.p1  ORF type:complete len:642 (-),score=82.22 GHVN01029963.1:467-2125(-)